MSGKGGVGKSIVTSMLSVLTRRRDYETAILDADITGPSIPKAFGAKGEVLTTGDALLPLETKTGIKMMSVNLLLEDETKTGRLARSRDCGNRKAVLDGCHMG